MTTNDTGSLPEPFLGFEGPNYTQVPDALFDELLAYLSGAEIKVLMYIIRRTFGFKRDSDTISLSQMLTGITTRNGKVLDRGTGLSKPSLLRALRSLQERQIIFTERRRSIERGDEPTVYRLNVRDKTPGKKMSLPLVKKVVQGGGQEISPGPWSKNVSTQETDLQETVEQETDYNISNIRKVQPGKAARAAGKTQPASSSLPADEPDTTPEAVGEVLERRFARTPRSQPRPEAGTEEYQRIQALIGDRAREFADSAPLKSSTTRAWNLFHRSGLSISTFESKIFQAKALTLEATARITNSSTDPQHRGRKNKMAYFFATLEDQLNLITPEERARRTGVGEEPMGAKRGRSPKAAGAGEDQPRTGRKPDSEGPYGAYIKS